MNQQEQRAKVAAFQRRHRVALLTLLFTDIVGSTQLKQDLGDVAGVELIHRHHDLVRELLGQFSDAEEIETAGDSFLLVFAKPSDAVKFSLQLQARLRLFVRQHARPLVDRIGIHVGEVIIEERPDESKDLYGIQVDTCARVMSIAEGGQIILTRAAFDNARQVLKHHEIERVDQLSWVNHGSYCLKGVEEPIELCEVGEVCLAPLRPPGDSEKAKRYVSADTETVLGWRPGLDQLVPGTSWVLEEKLGEGGFGEVWLGRHQTLKERRVFKFCFRADRVRPLKREVTLFRLLKEKIGNHPNIVGVQEVNFHEPPFYIVMDYSASRDLRSWFQAQGGPQQVSLELRVEIVAQAADALNAAHAAGVIHRDVKPSNILIAGGRWPMGDLRSEPRPELAPSTAAVARLGGQCDPQSQILVKLTDFGIGQIVSAEALAGLTRMGFTQTLISPGSTSQTGTLLYMAPELIAGGPATKQSDIYSLGVVLYQLIIGDLTRPMTADWSTQIGDPILREDLGQCFAGNPAERFSSAAELAGRLRSLEKRREERDREEAAALARQDADDKRALLRTGFVVSFIVMAFFLLVLSQFYQFSIYAHMDYWQTNILLLTLTLGSLAGLCAGATFGRVWTSLLGALLGAVDGAAVGSYLNLANARASGFVAVTMSFGVLTLLPVCLLLFRAQAQVRKARLTKRQVSLEQTIDSCRRRMLYCGGFAALSITLCVVLFYAEEDWRGSRAWARAKQRLEAKGQHLDWAFFTPPKVPDAENFFKAPSMAEWFQGGGGPARRSAPVERFPELPPWLNSIPPTLGELRDWKPFLESNPRLGTAPPDLDPAGYLLKWFEQYDPQLRQIHDACQRPHARMDGNYEIACLQPIENFVHFRAAAQILLTCAKAHVVKNQSEAAWRDLTTCRRLTESLSGRSLISAMIGVAIRRLYVHTAGEGIAAGAWNDAQLEMLQRELGRFNFPVAVVNSVRADRAGDLQLLTSNDARVREVVKDLSGAFHVVPSGWLRQNACVMSEVLQDFDYASLSRTTPYNFIAQSRVPNLVRARETAQRGQDLAAQGMIACALERYRHAHQTYPASLGALVPEFIDKLPDDSMTGQPFKYRLLAKGRFLLYAVGEDRKDDGGDEKSDWVWPYSPSP